MRLTKTARRLKEELEQFTIVDAHEHLLPESQRTSVKVDVFVLFSHYTRVDLVAAGMKPEEHAWLMNPDEDLDKRWRFFKPYLQEIRYGSYARPAFIAAKELFGYDDINDATYGPLSERIAEGNKPGIYKALLRQKCKIEKSLVCTMSADHDQDLFAPVARVDAYAVVDSRQLIERHAAEVGMNVGDLDDYVEVIKASVKCWKEKGAVGLKSRTGPYRAPSRQQAEEVFKRIMKGTDENKGINPLSVYLREVMYDIAAEEELTVAVHTGMWGDFRQLQAIDFMPVIASHPQTRFDLFHAGMPSPRETGVIGKNFPNVTLNLCWCHIISQEMTCSALQEWIDLVPVNKIIAFGADYARPVEKVYGHLVMARENIAWVLADRVDSGRFGMDGAVRIARKLFYENPRRIYRLGAQRRS